MHIRNRNDLIEWLESNAPRRAIARALQEGLVENLGAFEKVGASSQPGWIVKVTSKFNKVWYVTVYYKQKFRCFIRELEPCWKNWIGEYAKNKLYQGDNPLQYKELRDARKTKERRSD